MNQPQKNFNQNQKSEKSAANNLQKKSKVRTLTPQKRKKNKIKVNSASPTRKIALVEKKPQKSTEKMGLLRMLVFYPLRLLILGVGLGAIAGSVLASYQDSSLTVVKTEETEEINSDLNYHPPSPLTLKEEIIPLKEKLVELTAKYPKMDSGVFLVDLDNGNYVSIKGDSPFASASTIKIPILVAFFQDVDAGKINLDQVLTMTEEVIADGSGDMQYQKPGTQFTALETAEKMIIISDNTATNMIIELLGGIEAVNERFWQWGLHETVIRNPLPDLEGTNTTSSRDLVQVLGMVTRGELISLRSRDRLLGIMRRTKTDTLLPQGLETGGTIAHKTGDIGTMLGDAGVVDIPNGKRYLVATLVKRPHNDYAAKELIQQISHTIYQHLKFYAPRSLVQETNE